MKKMSDSCKSTLLFYGGISAAIRVLLFIINAATGLLITMATGILLIGAVVMGFIMKTSLTLTTLMLVIQNLLNFLNLIF